MGERKTNYITKTFRYEGKKYFAYGKTEEEALTKKIQMMAELKNQEKTSGGNMLVDDWFRQWMEVYKMPSGITEKSLDQYRQKYNRFVSPAIGRKKLKDVREIDLQRILNNNAGQSFSQLSKLRMVMQAMFEKARKTRMIPFDPAEDLVLPEYSKGSRRSLTEAERSLFLKVEPNVKGGVFYFAMLYTGMRPGELIALQWRDIDFKENQINVCRALESGSWNTLKDPKTDAGTRVIPIRKELLARLQELPKGDPTSPVFLNQAGNMHNMNSVQRLWGSICRAMDIEAGAEVRRNKIVESKIADDLVPYCLRHTFCTDLQNAGVPINLAKELMGHSDISVTANIYTHRNEKLLQKTIAQMDKKKGGSKGGSTKIVSA